MLTYDEQLDQNVPQISLYIIENLECGPISQSIVAIVEASNDKMLDYFVW